MLRLWRAAPSLVLILGCASVEAQSFCVQIGPPSPDVPVDLFLAMQNGWLGGRVIVRDQYHGKIVLQNLTKLPLQIDLPDVLGARPVLAQQGLQFPGLSGQMPGGGQASAPQPVGGTTARGGNPFGNGPFNIAPEQVRIVDFRCFCLEQGKPNPRSAVKYELAPLAEVNDDPRLPELLAAYAAGDVDRDTAQAAVWHAANDLSWNELAALSRRIANGFELPLFNVHQLRKARSTVESIERQIAKQQEPSQSTVATFAKPPRL